MVKELLMMNYAAVMLTICLLIFIITNNYFHKNVRSLFLVSCMLLLILVAADSVEYWTASLDHLSALRIWMSAIGYSLRPSIVFVMIRLMSPQQKKSGSFTRITSPGCRWRMPQKRLGLKPTMVPSSA